MAIRALDCCGIKELSGISRYTTPEDAFFQSCATLIPYQGIPTIPSCRFLIFSQANRSVETNYDTNTSTTLEPPTEGYGYRMAQFIRDNNLGTVYDSIEVAQNPNSNNHLKMWVWEMDSDACRKWLAAYAKTINYKPEVDDQGRRINQVLAAAPPPDVYPVGGAGAPAGVGAAFRNVPEAQLQAAVPNIGFDNLLRRYMRSFGSRR